MTITTAQLRLSADAITVATSRGIAVYSDSGAILLEGPDASLVAEVLFPLLDGRRTAAELSVALGKIDPADLSSVLEALQNHGLISDGGNDQTAASDSATRQLLLQSAKIFVTGVEPWLTLAVGAIRATGVKHVSSVLEAANPADIALGVFLENEPKPIKEFVRYAHAKGIRCLVCVLGADEVRIGPFAVPRRSACWNCGHLRLIANAEQLKPRSGSSDPLPEIDALIGAVLARELCGAITKVEADCRLINHLLVLDRRSLQISLHRVLGVPGCEICGGPAGFDRVDGQRERELAGALPGDMASQLLSWFVDSRTGVIHRVVLEDSTVAGLEIPIIASAISADAPMGPRRCMPVGWGRGITSSAAIIGAVGEAMERYSACMADPSRIVCSRPADLSGDWLDPRSLALYSDDQYLGTDFPFVRFDPHILHPWVAGEWMGDHRSVWLPAILVYLFLEVSSEQVFCQGTSNGLAAGIDQSEAALRAILELLERDAFMSCWRSKQSGQHIRLDQALDSDLLGVINGIREFGAEVELVLLLSACGYPTALCLAFGDGVNWPGVTLGLGADPDAGAAVRQAILELGQTGPYLRRLMRQKTYATPANKHQVKQMLDHASYYFPAERGSAFDYLRCANHSCSLADFPKGAERSLSACARALAMSGIRIALVEVTSPDIAMAQFHVVRAISPDLQAISFGYGLDRQPVPRLAQFNTAISRNEIVPIW